jgi:hypothetical protein
MEYNIEIAEQRNPAERYALADSYVRDIEE